MSLVDKFKNWKPQKQRALLEELLLIHATTEYSELLYGKIGALEVAWHDTPESIHRARWAGAAEANGMTYEDLFSHMTIEAGDNGLGDIVGNTPEQVIKGIRDQGCWAFADHVNRVLHLWIGPTVPPDLIIQMIASELAHLTPDRWVDEQLNELRNSQFGYVANVAYQILNDAMERRSENLEG